MKISDKKFEPLDRAQFELKVNPKKEINDFLKTRAGFNYLMLKYPNLSVQQAIRSYAVGYYQALSV